MPTCFCIFLGQPFLPGHKRAQSGMNRSLRSALMSQRFLKDQVILETDFSICLRERETHVCLLSNHAAAESGHCLLPFERSSSMSRASRLSFIRADLYEPVWQRIMLSYMMTACEEKTPRKKKKPARRPAGKTKQGMRSCTGSSRSLWKKAGGWRIIPPPRRICAGSCARRPFLR